MTSCHSLLTKGETASAQAVLKSILRSKIGRADLLDVCRLLARAEMPMRALRILNPIVRNTQAKVHFLATPEETVLYAGCLTKVGAFKEAIDLLNKVQRPITEKPLYKAFAFFGQWDYAKAIPNLLAYIEAPEISEYQRAVARTNLAGCYVHERAYGKAEDLLQELRDYFEGKDWVRLRGNIQLLSAEGALQQRKWNEAELFLKAAEKDFAQTAGLDPFFVKKWRAFVHVSKTNGSQASLRALAVIKKQAESYKHWETIRDCDRLKAVMTQDETLFRHLYFGTPYESFRIAMIRDFGTEPRLGPYQWKLGNPRSNEAPLNIPDAFKPGSISFRLLNILSSDFYRPFRMAPLYAHLYPELHFSPSTATHRTHVAVGLLRQALVELRIPLQVEEVAGDYRLTSKKGCLIEVGRRSIATPMDLALEKLRAQWPNGRFSITQAESFLEMSRRSIQRILQEACSTGHLSREGQTSKTRYFFTQNKVKTAA